MKNSFKRNLVLGFGLSILLLIISSAASFVSITNLRESSTWVNHTTVVIDKLQKLLAVIKDAENGQRGYLLTADESFLQPYNGAYENSLTLIQEIKMLTSDNPEQQPDADVLLSVSKMRLDVLAALIKQKRNNEPLDKNMLMDGKKYMENYTAIVNQMRRREEILLVKRTASLDKFTNATPIFIVIAALFAIIVTLVSFYKVMKDYDKRVALQLDLIKKDEEISHRINIIEAIADKIAAGDYKTRVDDKGKDVLGNLSGSLNKMAVSLDDNFRDLSEREWLQTGVGKLNEKMIGEKNIKSLTYNVLQFIVDYCKVQVGAFYLVRDQSSLYLSAFIALNKNDVKKELAFGEGLAGQCAKAERPLELFDMSTTELVINHTSASIRPAAVLAVPVFFEGRLKGVIELASLERFSKVTHDFLQVVSFNIGMAIRSAIDHQKMEELLHETQAQSEELQSQHSEMENVNAELEIQAEKLQASEEELKVQQEELQQSNAELEERSRLLEEKNELILERNLEIQAKAEALELSTKYKSEFLANMSHELRTPLNSILLLSRLMSENQNGNLSDDQVEYATVIQSSGNGLLTLIDEILDLSRIESGKMELEYQEVSVEQVTNELRSLFQPIAKDKGIDFTIENKLAGQPFIETDRLRLEQILRNLISNALKFTRQGSVTLEISKAGEHIFFAVQDTGIGIAPDKLQTVFEAFQQADGSTRRKYGGTGLGLSISRELAKLLQGEISLQSEEGKGSRFTLKMPFYKDLSPASFGAVGAPESISEIKVDNPYQKYIAAVIPESIEDDRESLSADDKIILIVEDDISFASALLDYTRAQGYKGVVVVRGDEALSLARQYRPLGILLDIQLPVKSGWEVMDELKADPATRPIPVHIMSSHEVKTKSLSKGAVDFINKPVAFDKLGEVFLKIEKALSQYPKKVLIVEENSKHALALAYFLEGFNVVSEIKNSVDDGIQALVNTNVDCVILDMGIPSNNSYNTLEEIKKTPGLENLPIIIFTGKNLSHVEEVRIKRYADSIVVKTAHSYQRILDEVSLFLHLVEENKVTGKYSRYKRLGEAGEVLKGKTVLVADDDVRNIFSISKSLESYGIEVISATDGKEALSQLNNVAKIDLVLMDMMMPEMDGYESTRLIRKMPRYYKLPIIAVTAKAMTGDREKCIEAGASDYITKPIDVDQLISLLRVWLYE